LKFFFKYLSPLSKYKKSLKFAFIFTLLFVFGFRERKISLTLTLYPQGPSPLPQQHQQQQQQFNNIKNDPEGEEEGGGGGGNNSGGGGTAWYNRCKWTCLVCGKAFCSGFWRHVQEAHALPKAAYLEQYGRSGMDIVHYFCRVCNKKIPWSGASINAHTKAGVVRQIVFYLNFVRNACFVKISRVVPRKQCCGSGMGSEFFPSRIRDPHQRIRILTFYPSRIQGSKWHRIRIRNTARKTRGFLLHYVTSLRAIFASLSSLI
jgi:hypothetical protein